MSGATTERLSRPPVVLRWPTSPVGDVDPMAHNPLLAYPLEVIDPMATACRDEGALRLPHMRAALYQIRKSGHERLCEAEGVGTLVAALSPVPRLRPDLHASIFQSGAPRPPRICLVAPRARVFAPELADAMTEEDRVQCIPIEGDAHGSVAFPDWPFPARKRVVVQFQAGCVGPGGAASMTLERAGVDGLTVQAVSSNGERSEWRGTAAEPVLEKLFASSWEGTLGAPRRVPALPGELPQMLMDEVADFWQRHARCHVVASACAPESATRPLGFASIKAHREGKHHPRAVVRAKLHRSSCACACSLWKLPSPPEQMPHERFVSSEVELTMSMCGRRLSAETKLCPLHGEATPSVPLLDHVCCHGTVAALQCSHHTQDRRPPTVGLRQYDLRLRGLNVLHIQVLVDACLQCAESVAPMLGKQPPAEIGRACEAGCAQARRKLDAVTRERSLRDDASSDTLLERNDMKAHDLLVEGGVRQHERPTTKSIVLAKLKDDGSAVVLKEGEGAELVATHLGLFPPPPKKARKRRL